MRELRAVAVDSILLVIPVVVGTAALLLDWLSGRRFNRFLVRRYLSQDAHV